MYIDVFISLILIIACYLALYLLIGKYFKQQFQLESFRLNNREDKSIKGVRLQAYERLMLLIDRISIDSLSIRLIGPDMGVKELQNAEGQGDG